MIQDFYLKDWDWSVRVYYFVDEFYFDMISNDLMFIGCSNPDNTIGKMLDSLPNSGLTFSSPDRCSIIVIGETTSAKEFQSTLDHEKGHLGIHIALFNDIDFISEEYQYLAGEIGKQMYPVARYFLCDHCYNDIKSLKGTLISNE